jgi:hypothetical protein
MVTTAFVMRKLHAIEKKNQIYFTKNNLKILDCVLILGTRLASVHIIKEDLPYAIRYDIETLFWRE